MKITILGLFMLSSLQAVSYEELLEYAIKNNVALQVNKTKEEQLALQGEIATRYENPNIELGVSSFWDKGLLRNNEFGTSIGIRQSLLLPSVKDDRKSVTYTKIAVATQRNRLEKAAFLYSLDMKYLDYREVCLKESLVIKELEVLESILNMKEEQFSLGSISKSVLLETKIEKLFVKSTLNELQVKIEERKNELFLFANMFEDSKLEGHHTFVREMNKGRHPLLELTQQKKELAQSQLNLVSHKIEQVEVFSVLENEPTEDIFKIGISIPFPVFNKKKEEQQLAKIAMRNEALRLSTQEKSLDLELLQLQSKIRSEEVLSKGYEALLTEKVMLLAIYEKAYSIAKVNLVKINKMKRDTLEIKRKILEGQFRNQQNIIKINYLQGTYHE